MYYCNSIWNISNIFIIVLLYSFYRYHNRINLNLDSNQIVETDNEDFNYPTLIKINKETISNTGVELIFDDSLSSVGWSEKYYIEKYENKKWTRIEFKNSPMYNTVVISNVKKLTQNWIAFYGELKPGYYRIVKVTAYAMDTDPHEQFYYSEPFEIKN